MEVDLNANLAEKEGDRRGEDIVASLATEVLEDTSTHFLPELRPWFRDGRTWGMIQEGGGGGVPDGLHPGDEFPSLWKCLRPGP